MLLEGAKQNFVIITLPPLLLFLLFETLIQDARESITQKAGKHRNSNVCSFSKEIRSLGCPVPLLLVVKLMLKCVHSILSMQRIFEEENRKGKLISH